MTDISSRLSHTGRLLVRSGIEIERLLAAIIEDGDAVTAKLPADHLFLSRLVSMDTDDQEVLLAPSEHKPLNTALLATPGVNLLCHHRGAQFAFRCTKPRPGMYAGQLAIRMTEPTVMLAAQGRQHRSAPRPQVPAEADVRCELRMGLISFTGRLVDVGLDGKAYIVTDAAVPACDGTRLKGARVRQNGDEPLVVDLHIDKVNQAVLADGKRASRIGCRILTERDKLEAMIRLFVVDLQ